MNRSYRCLLLAVLCTNLISLAISADLSKISVDPDDHWFFDRDGRVRIFHGVNCVQKGYPWYPEYLLNKTRLDDLKEFGLNVVRLGSMWSGVEPAEGEYNATYIAVLKQIVDELSERGIYVMLDMHQDVLTSIYHSYDGVPRWLVETFPPPNNSYPWPLQQINSWAMGYFTQGVSEGFQYIYDNYNDALTRWADFWEHMTINFKDHTSVMGYDLMNEPWAGDYITLKRLLLPGVAGKNNLLPAYDVITERIRKHDSEGIIFYEPVSYGQVFPNGFIGSGFDRVPGGEQYKNVSAYNYHMYCLYLEALGSGGSDTVRERARSRCESDLLPRIFESAIRNVEQTGGGRILSEFGLCKSVDGGAVNIECEVMLRLADTYLESWIDWDYNDRKWYSTNGERTWDKIRWYVRPYAQATAGVPTNMSLDPHSLQFTFTFNIDTSISAPTEIFVPNVHYSDGYDVTVTSHMEWSADKEEQMLYVTSDGNVPDGTSVTVVITDSSLTSPTSPSSTSSTTTEFTSGARALVHNLGYSVALITFFFMCL